MIVRVGDRVFVPNANSWGTVQRTNGTCVRVFLDRTADWEWFERADLEWTNEPRPAARASERVVNTSAADVASSANPVGA